MAFNGPTPLSASVDRTMMKLVLLATLVALAGVASMPAAEAHEYVCVPTQGCTEVSNLIDNCYVFVPNVRSSYCIL